MAIFPLTKGYPQRICPPKIKLAAFQLAQPKECGFLFAVKLFRAYRIGPVPGLFSKSSSRYYNSPLPG